MVDDELIPQAKRMAAILITVVAGSMAIFAAVNIHEKVVKHISDKREAESIAVAEAEAESVRESKMAEMLQGNTPIPEDTGAYQRKNAKENLLKIQQQDIKEDDLKTKEDFILERFGDEDFMPVLDKVKNLYSVGDYKGIYDYSVNMGSGIVCFTEQQYEKLASVPSVITDSVAKGGLNYYYSYMNPINDAISVGITAEDSTEHLNYFVNYYIKKGSNGEWKLDRSTLCDKVFGVITIPQDAEDLKINGFDCSDLTYTDFSEVYQTKTSEQAVSLIFCEGENIIEYTENGEKKKGTVIAFDKFTGKQTDDPQVLKDYIFKADIQEKKGNENVK